jgi:hypothetical protein
MANALSLVQKMEGWENVAQWVAKSLKNLEKSEEIIQTPAQVVNGYEQQVKKVLSAKITAVYIDGDLNSVAKIIKNFEENFEVNDPYYTYLFESGEVYDDMAALSGDTVKWNGGITLESQESTSSVRIEWTAVIQGKIIDPGYDDGYGDEDEDEYEDDDEYEDEDEDHED